MLANLTGWHFLLLVAVVLILFGAAKLPQLARGAGQSMRILRAERRAFREEFSESSREPEVEERSAGSAPPG